MDAEDIFRKLTTGAIPRFLKLPSNGKIIKQSLHAEKIAPSSLSQNVMKEKNNFLQIKRELLDEDEDEEEEELTLLGNMKAGKKDNKPNKKNQKLKKQKTKRQKSAELKLEKINQLRNLHRITVVGDNVPPPIETFDQFVEECKISTKIINNLKASGYVTPTPIQMQAIPVMLQSRQILACAPTGSGKTAAFVVPILHNLGTPKNEGFRALIVCPTRELARQIFRECSWLAEGTGLRAHIISKVKQSADKFGPKFANKFDILISTPNRIIYLLRQENVTLSLKTVEWLIVDESDKLFEVGIRGFRDQLAEIYKACDASNIKRAMFSATHTVHVTKWCRKNLKGLVSVTIGHRNTAADLVQQELIFVGSEHGKLIEFRNLVHQGLPPPVLVFVQSKDRAKELFNELIYDGINVDVIHADRTQFQRDNVVRAFREGKVWVLICTELMGRGIDFKGVNLVINYDFPTSAISYIHRIGRTGRAGRAGRAVTFFTESDRPALRSIATVMKDSGCEVPEYMLSLKKTSKRDRRKLEQMAPDRKPISTTPSYAKYKNNKLKKRIEMTKKQKESRKTDIGADCS